MTDERAGERLPDAERAENLLRSSAFFRSTSISCAMNARLMAVGGGAALGAGVGGGLLARTGPGVAHASSDPATDFGAAAVGAARIAVAFYTTAADAVNALLALGIVPVS